MIETIDILAFSPHPDDAELGCGGTLILSVEKGLKTAVADLSEGECSSRGTGEQREEEKRCASKLLKLHNRFSLGFPDTQIGSSPSHRTAIIDLIRKARPRIVLAPYWKDRHPDHEAAGMIIKEACFYAGVASVGTGDPFRPDRIYYYMAHSPFTPSFVIDVSSVWERKLAVISAYRTQFFNDEAVPNPTALSDPAFLRFCEGRCAYYGAMIGVSYGEPFFSVEPVSLDMLPGVEMPRSSGKWSPKYKCF